MTLDKLTPAVALGANLDPLGLSQCCAAKVNIDSLNIVTCSKCHGFIVALACDLKGGKA